MITYPAKSIALILLLSFPLLSIAQKASIASPMMNVMYIGVDNPFVITASGYPPGKVVAEISSGTLRKQGNTYIARVMPGTETHITVYGINKNGKRDSLITWSYRVKSLPDPVPYVAGKTGGMISKGELAAAQGILAKMNNFDWDAKFLVNDFKVVFYRNDSIYDAYSLTGNRFSSLVLKRFSSIQGGSKIRFEDIHAIGPDSTLRLLPPLELLVTDDYIPSKYPEYGPGSYPNDPFYTPSNTMNKYDPKFRKQNYWIEVFGCGDTGCTRVEKGYYSKGIRTGEWKVYSREKENYKLIEERLYSGKELTAIKKYRNEKLAYIFNYKDARLCGKYEEYYDNGKLHLSGEYTLDTLRRDTLWMEEYSTDNTGYSVQYYIKEVRTGWWKEYNTEGKLVKETLYRKDEAIEVKKY